MVSDEGWQAETRRIVERKENQKTGKVTEKDKGWVCDLVPKDLIVARYFSVERDRISRLEADLESVTAERTELEEEHSGDEGIFAEFDKVNKAAVAARLKELKNDRQAGDEVQVLKVWQKLNDHESGLKKEIKGLEADLDRLAYEKYPLLSPEEIRVLVVDDKWLGALRGLIAGELDRISQGLTQRVKVLAERYEKPLPEVMERVQALESKVAAHLAKMGFSL